VYTWGEGSSGQLGHGNNLSLSEPTLVKALEGLIVSQIFSIAAHSAALTNTGALYTWGWIGTKDMNNAPLQVEALRGQRIQKVALGAYHTAVLLAEEEGSNSGGRVHTWGFGAKGQLGHGDLLFQAEPKLLEALEDINVVDIFSSESYMAALSKEGCVYLWGSNEKGVLSVNVTQSVLSVPSLLTDLSGIVHLACGVSSIAAVTREGAVFTWGKNSEGQLGHGGEEDTIQPPKQVAKLAGTRIVGLAADNNYTIAWSDRGQAFSWGSNRNNRLGIASDDPIRTEPTLIPSLNGKNIIEVSCSSRTIVACVGKKIFGIPLMKALEEGDAVPGVIRECISFLMRQCECYQHNPL
jgi:alpha-tubulin suppressor-like RCC1 family protein